VRTVHGELAVVRHGDWIVPEKTPGRFYPVKPDVFAATYEPVAQVTEISVHVSETAGDIGRQIARSIRKARRRGEA
jgi:hypothetical protein